MCTVSTSIICIFVAAAVTAIAIAAAAAAASAVVGGRGRRRTWMSRGGSLIRGIGGWRSSKESHDAVIE